MKIRQYGQKERLKFSKDAEFALSPDVREGSSSVPAPLTQFAKARAGDSTHVIPLLSVSKFGRVKVVLSFDYVIK